MNNEKGLTLVELLAVIVILAIIAIIAVVSIAQILNNVKADTHLENARNVLEAGKLAHVTGESPKHDFNYAKNYTLQELADMGYLSGKLKSPTIFSWSRSDQLYDMENSMVVVDERESLIIYKVNLSLGELNYIFTEPMEHHEITRDSFTDTMKEELKLK